MKKFFLAAGVAALFGSLGACAEGYGPHGYVGADVAYVGGGPVGYDGFYDDYYGPFYDGYWGGDGFYYYSDGAGHPYRRDTAHHFSHQAATGFHPVHGGAARHDGGDHRS